MALRPELAPGLSEARRSSPLPGATAPSPMWDDRVLLRLPDAALGHAVEVARAAVSERIVLEPDADGTARLALRLAHLDAEDDRLTRILGVLRSRAEDGMVLDRQGLPDPIATSVLGRCEAAQGDPRAWDRLHALADPLGRIDVGEGPPNLSAALLALVGELLVGRRPGEVVVLPVLPDEWFGEDAEVRGLPVVGGGRVSWALTWPSDWPALQWASSVPGCRVTAPGLLPGWSDPRPRGHLGPVQDPPGAPL